MSKEFHVELQPQPQNTFASSHGRETVRMRHLSEAVQQEVVPQVAQTCAQQRADLQVPGLPEEVRQRQQIAQSLGDK